MSQAQTINGNNQAVILVYSSCKINDRLYTGNKYVACNCDKLNLHPRPSCCGFMQRYYIIKCASKHC